MAHVKDRWYRVVEGEKTPTDRHGTGRRWRARWIDPDGRERSQSFDRRVDAERRLAAVEGDKLRGLYVDPRAGQVTLRKYAAEWLAAQTFDESSREGVEYRLRLHVFPHLGDREIGAIRSSHVQTLLRALQEELAPSYVRAIFLYLSAVMSAAVDDGRITKNPCKASSIKVRGPEPRKVHPWTHDQVQRLHQALPARYKVVVAVAAGCGLRQGEVFGLAVEDIDFLRRVIHVRRQVKLINSRLVFAPQRAQNP